MCCAVLCCAVVGDRRVIRRANSKWWEHARIHLYWRIFSRDGWMDGRTDGWWGRASWVVRDYEESSVGTWRIGGGEQWRGSSSTASTSRRRAAGSAFRIFEEAEPEDVGSSLAERSGGRAEEVGVATDHSEDLPHGSALLRRLLRRRGRADEGGGARQHWQHRHGPPPAKIAVSVIVQMQRRRSRSVGCSCSGSGLGSNSGSAAWAPPSRQMKQIGGAYKMRRGRRSIEGTDGCQRDTAAAAAAARSLRSWVVTGLSPHNESFTCHKKLTVLISDYPFFEKHFKCLKKWFKVFNRNIWFSATQLSEVISLKKKNWVRQVISTKYSHCPGPTITMPWCRQQMRTPVAATINVSTDLVLLIIWRELP